ncbi:MAG: hypothetical protein ABI183_18985 [Polyangiaceae bacterium]
MRSWILVLASLSVTACGAVGPSPYDASSWGEGWGTSHAVQPAEIYPTRFRRISKEELQHRADALKVAPWMLSLGPSGYLAQATRNVEDGDDLSSQDLEQAQSFIDTHLALMGLARSAALKKWDDGLAFISPVDDPRFGISVLHRGPRLTITGHLWPNFTFRSSARRDLAALLAPWLGTRVTSSDVIVNPPCDPVNSIDDCPRQSEPPVAIVGPSLAHYVVNATEVGDAIEVREVLVLDLPHNPKPMDAGKTLPPSAFDARTGEPLNVSAFGSGMCEGDACVSWGSARTEQNFLFWHWVSFERLQSDVVNRPQP